MAPCCYTVMYVKGWAGVCWPDTNEVPQTGGSPCACHQTWNHEWKSRGMGVRKNQGVTVHVSPGVLECFCNRSCLLQDTFLDTFGKGLKASLVSTGDEGWGNQHWPVGLHSSGCFPYWSSLQDFSGWFNFPCLHLFKSCDRLAAPVQSSCCEAEDETCCLSAKYKWKHELCWGARQTKESSHVLYSFLIQHLFLLALI